MHGAPLVLALLLPAGPVPQEPHGELAPLELRVNRAIAHGVDYLRRCQLPSGDFPEHAGAHPGGAAALVAYAWVKSGLRRRDPDLLRALEVVRSAGFRSTYAHSVRLLAMESLGTPGAWAEEAPASLAFLVGGQRAGLWAYPWGEPDLSNTQLALLGLRAARAMGLELPDDVLKDAAVAVWRFQRKDAGFTYRPGGAPTGGMTAATLGGLSLFESLSADVPALRAPLRKHRKERARAEAWMAARLDLAHNPHGPRAWTTEWHYIYLWAIERWAGLAGLERIGGRDWYAQGARLLVDDQRPDGSWGPGHRRLQNTCFALLFLRRATVSTEGELEQLYAELDRELAARAPELTPAPDVPRQPDWLLAGPWQGEEGNGLLLEPPFDPAAIKVREGGRVARRKWERVALRTEGWTDLEQTTGRDGEFQLWLLATTLALDGESPLELLLWFDLEDGWDAYLDGERVSFGQRVASRIDGLIRADVTLAPGEHRLVVLVEQERGALPFGLRVTTTGGRAPPAALRVGLGR